MCECISIISLKSYHNERLKSMRQTLLNDESSFRKHLPHNSVKFYLFWNCMNRIILIDHICKGTSPAFLWCTSDQLRIFRFRHWVLPWFLCLQFFILQGGIVCNQQPIPDIHPPIYPKNFNIHLLPDICIKHLKICSDTDNLFAYLSPSVSTLIKITWVILQPL